MLLGRESYAGVIHECSPVCACKGAACDLVSDQPFPKALGTCTWLCPANCIQERITHKERSTSHFTLEEVGWFSDMAASRLPEYSSLVVSTVNGKVIGNDLLKSVPCVRHQDIPAGQGAACDLVFK